MTDETMPRETGSEKAEQKCPTCGGAMQVSESAYGSTTASCPKCEKAAPTEKAAEQATPREVGTDVKADEKGEPGA